MDLVGFLFFGLVLICGSVYAAWSICAVWKESRSGSDVARRGFAARIQQGLVMACAGGFLSVALVVCSHIASGQVCPEGLNQLRVLVAGSGGNLCCLPWGTSDNLGSLHVSTTYADRRVTGASLAYLDFGDADLAQLLQEHRHIEWFILSGTQITDSGLALFRAAPHLEGLVLMDTRISDEGLLHLGDQPNLSELDLTRTSVTDAGLETVGQMTKLTRLCLRETRISDGGLRHILPLENLKVLSVEHTAISDAAIQQLVSLTKLEAIDVTGSRISEEGVQQIQRTLPGCHVVRRVQRPH